MNPEKQKILIVDDSEMNRAILADMLEDQYDLVEAENGAEAIAILQQQVEEIALMLLDIVMPEMNGFEVLACMQKHHWNENLAVIMISSDASPANMKQAYDLGAFDYIGRPFDPSVVLHRVSNTMLLYAKQRRLEHIVAAQLYEQAKDSQLMISILSHVVEFRNGESGSHVLHIHAITELLLSQLMEKTDRYPLSKTEVARICTASSLHDIGKLSIPDEILNKPGRLTAEEFKVMKSHSMAGADLLRQLSAVQQEDPLVKTAYEICRWHHERYDGGGYPDGLKGEEIPISAQVVSLADVYDALTSERCYKKAFPHEKAMEMILGGQCGAFNPLLLECLQELSPTLERELKAATLSTYKPPKFQDMEEQLHDLELFSSERTAAMLTCEQQKYQFLAEANSNLVFTYTTSPSIITWNAAGVETLATEELVVDPEKDEAFLQRFGKENFSRLLQKVEQASPGQPFIRMDVDLPYRTGQRKYHCFAKTIWSADEPKEILSLVGELVPLDEERLNQSKTALIQHAVRACAPDRDLDHFAVTGVEAWGLTQYLSLMFDRMRLVKGDPLECVRYDSQGQCSPDPEGTAGLWLQEPLEEDCLSAKVLSNRCKYTKFSVMDERSYHILAFYVEVDDWPCCLELMTDVSERSLFGADGKQNLVQTLTQYNQKLYTDVLTGAYNRRYYEEQMRDVEDHQALAVLDLDRFKSINDNFGHQVGDIALQEYAKTVRSSIRKTDCFIRYGGDEYVVIFRDIPLESFVNKLEELRGRIYDLKLPGYPEIQLSASIGGVYGFGKTVDMFRCADTLAYEAKEERNKVIVRSISEVLRAEEAWKERLL